MDAIKIAGLPTRALRRLCVVPEDLEAITVRGDEVPPREIGLAQGAVDRVWDAIEAFYRSGLHPAIQVCIRRQGRIVLHRALGHADGNEPGADPDAPRTPAGLDTPFTIFSASKAITAMVVHKLDERGLLHLDDRVCEYIPEFGVHGKEWITIRHVLAHRAGIPNVPPEAMDLELLGRPDEVAALMASLHPVSRPGRRLAYHAISGGFVLGEVVRRVTGQDIRAVLAKEVCEPLGFRWMNYGVAAKDVHRVARNSFTGFPVFPPVSNLLARALGTNVYDVIDLSNDPRFLAGVIPAGNVVATASELSAFFQCLQNEGQLDGVRIFDPRTIRRAVQEQSYWELDLTLGVPLRYGLGFMLGGWLAGLFGPDTPRAFGHLGFSNIIAWTDPERQVSGAICCSGKPVVSLDVLRLYQVMIEIGRAFRKIED